MNNKKISSGNMAEPLFELAAKNPRRIALYIPLEWNESAVTRYDTATFGDLAKKIKAYQGGLQKAGYRAGDRVIIMVPPSVDLYCIIIALLASGMVPVLVDAGMGLRRMVSAFDQSGARTIITIKKLGRLRYLIPGLWKYRCYAVDGKGIGFRHASEFRDQSRDTIEIVPCGRESHGIITFTSGSTGRPKGADRTHYGLLKQHLAIRKSWPDTPRDIDMTCFPVVVLHNMACGMTSVLTAVDFAAVGDPNPALVASQIRELRPTRLSAAPAFMRKLVDYMIREKMFQTSVRSVGIGGAPVPKTLCRDLRTAFPKADIRVIYGSTEAEPISSVSVEEILESEGKGFLVGKPYPFISVRIVDLPGGPDAITDNELDSYTVPVLTSGEIVVSGEHVLKGYVDNPEANRENKIPRANGTVWHRTGDTGYFDKKGRIWLNGRLKDAVRHRGRVIPPYLVEQMIDEIPGVSRSALVENDGKPVIALVIEKGADRLAVLNKVHEAMMGADCSDIPVRELDRMPVDRRHNSKIDRIALKKILK
ncbi:MAG TPA: AMP-binding protein [Spirochaetota bacterium]|nr:AMP-binding protein [Spirochaetota bacterium]HPC39680.1 AMP-binding protein [Spirochaetota bacterium]HPL17219.1 AMP-binding protein [Spirochaetota bacterium]HQF07407.1 AMP-binding protein [Spirochaetota bacterium]HQH96667.1 AMP-binding protein [Spirochaetota bacterium]